MRCSRSPSRVGLWASGWAALENEKDTTLTAIRVGVKILQFLFGLQIPLTRKPLSNPFRTLTIKWEIHILLKKSWLVLHHCVVVNYFAWICIWQYNSLPIKEWMSITKMHKTFLYENITFTLYFSKGVVCVREIGRWRETKTECQIDP